MASALDGCVEGVKPGCTKDVSWLPPQGGSGPLGHDGGAGGVVPPGGGVFVNGQCPCGPVRAEAAVLGGPGQGWWGRVAMSLTVAGVGCSVPVPTSPRAFLCPP